jgi:hypothetical protein
MKKRDLLKAPPAKGATFKINSVPVSMALDVPEKGRKLVIFVNEAYISVDWFEKYYKPFYAKRFKEILLVPIRIPQGKTFGDVVRAYDLPE